jgi:hypothetical protein
MGKTYAGIDEKLQEFISKQVLFFVATAPLGGDGHVNLSPKGHDTFRVISPTVVAYLDLFGSGAETVAHVKENGRLTIMFCALEGAPKILRLYGRGEVLEPGQPQFDALLPQFPPQPGTRSIIRLTLDRIVDSCGFGVPRYELVGPRRQLVEWAENKGPAELAEYRRTKNARSIDGLPAFDATDDAAVTKP